MAALCRPAQHLGTGDTRRLLEVCRQAEAYRSETRLVPRARVKLVRPPSQPDDAAWTKDVALLVSEHKLLREAVAGLDSAGLKDRKKLHLIRGVAAHDLYHAGQIQLLKRLSSTS